MWITFWAVTIALAIGLSVMAMGTQPKTTARRLSAKREQKKAAKA